MSRERIIKALNGLGLTKCDSNVYIYLAKQGPQEIVDIASMLNMNEKKIHESLKNLQSINIVTASIEHPQEFIAIPIEEVIELVIKVKREQAESLQASKKDLLSSWRSITKKNCVKS